MKRFFSLAVAVALAGSLAACSTTNSTKGAVKGNVTERMQVIVDNLITTYNTLDSVNFRRYFGPTLLREKSLLSTGALLRDAQTRNGKILKADIDASADGLSAVVTLHMERQTYDVKIELFSNGRLKVFDWAQGES